MQDYKIEPIDKITKPIQKFIQQEKSGGIILGISVIIALILANSTWSDSYFEILDYKFGFTFNKETYFNYSILHWINDGLMAIFFFVVGLELKREIVGGELSQPRKAILPIGAALGGMLVPALIYILFNPSGEVHHGWGIPMATDIAFALGVLYLLGNKIPFALKIFLTALAIVDDLGAVLVIAFFYTSDISILSLSCGFGFALIMFIGNKLGVKNVIFYAVFGIFGVWISFLLSGVHATIAAVLAAFMIPADVKIKENNFVEKIKFHLDRFRNIDPNNNTPTLTNDQVDILEEIKMDTDRTIPLLQRLEHSMHPFVTFFIIPIFAIANAGVSLDLDPATLFSTNVIFGVGFGLLIGKVLGIFCFTFLMVKFKIASFPTGMNKTNLLGLSFLGAIGFTMSLFITSLAFTHVEYMVQAKIGIFGASILGGIIGYMILNKKEVSSEV